MIKKAIIPVAGKGTRFLPATKEIPKEMIPILNIPMLAYVVEEAVDSGVEQVILVTSSGKQSIENYFDRNLELEYFLATKEKTSELDLIKKIGTMVDVVTVRQKEQLGLGHALLCAKDLVGDENFAVLLGDEIILSDKPVTLQLAEISKQNNNHGVIGVMEVDKSEVHRYGVVAGEKVNDKTLKMNNMVEKPSAEMAPSLLATPGRYIFTPEIFDCLLKIEKGAGGEYQLTDAIKLLAQQSDFYAHIFSGDRFDTGNVMGYFEATIEFALRDARHSKEAIKIIKNKIREYNL